MTDHKKAWHQATEEHKRIELYLRQPRCITCDSFVDGMCEHFGPVPEPAWYEPLDCRTYTPAPLF